MGEAVRSGDVATAVDKAWLLVETHQLDEARRIFDVVADSGFDAPFDFVWVRFASEFASVCARLGDSARAAVLHTLLEPYADRVVTIGWGSIVSGSVAHYLGLLDSLLRRAGPGDGERARELGTAALATAEEVGMARVAEDARTLVRGS